MPIMTADILVHAVQDLEEYPGALVDSRAIKTWCNKHHVDYGAGSFDKHFWDSDHEEARGQHRLLKFRTGTARNSGNRFARRLGPIAASVIDGTLSCKAPKSSGSITRHTANDEPRPTRRTEGQSAGRFNLRRKGFQRGSSWRLRRKGSKRT